MNKYCFKI